MPRPKEIVAFLLSDKVYAFWVQACFVSLFLSRSALVVCATVLILLAVFRWLSHPVLFPLPPLTVPFLAFFGAIFLSIALADPFPWSSPLGKLRYMILYFPLLYAFRDSPELGNRLRQLGVILSFFLGTLAVLQHFGVPFLEKLHMGHGAHIPDLPGRFHARGLLPHHTIFSSVCILLYHLMLWSAVSAVTREKKVLYGFSALFAAAALWATLSRGAWAAGIVSTAIVFVLWMGKAAIKPLLIGGAALVLLFFVSPSFQKRVSQITLRHDAERLALWRISWDMFKDAPVTGHGYHSFPVYRDRYMTPQDRAQFEEFPRDAHSLYLDLLSGTGLVGLLAFLWFALAAIRNAMKAIRCADPHSNDYGLALTGLGALLAVLLNNLTDTHFYNTFGLVGGILFLAFGQSIFLRACTRETR